MDFSREHTEFILDKLHLAMMKKDPHWQDKILSGNHADMQQFHKLQRMCLEQVLRSSEAEMTSDDWKALGEELMELKAVDIAKYALGKAEWLAGKKDRLEAEKADIEQKLRSETSPDVKQDHGGGTSSEKVPDKDVSVKPGNGKPDKEKDSESDKETAADDDSSKSKAKPDDTAGDDESDKGSEKFKHKDESEDKDKKDKKKKKFPFQKSAIAILISKAKKRNVGEIWTQPSGRKVKKVKEGMILPVNEHGQVIKKPEKAEKKPKQKPEQSKKGRKPADPDKKQSPKKKDQIPKKPDKSGKEEPPKESLSKHAKKGSDAVKAAIDAQKEQQQGGLGTDKIKPEEASKTEKTVKENKKSEGAKQDINDNPTQLNASDIQTIEQYTDKKDYDKEEIEALKNKILENGFDPAYPIMVDKQDGKWTVVAGHHRMEAVKSLIENNQLPADFKVPVISKVFASSNDRLAAQVMENQRRNVLATDEAKAYGKMLKDGWDAQKIAKKIGKKVGQVNKRLALNNLSKDLFTLVSKKDKALPLGVAEVLGMFGVNDDGSPNESMQIRAFKWYQENRGKLSTSAPVAIQSYIREMKSEGFKGFELESTLSDVQKEALRNVGSAEKAERNSKLIENMLSNLQKSYQRILGDSLSELTPETVNELGSSIAAQGNIHSSKTLGTIDVIIRDLSKIKESFENKIKEIQGNANIPLMFSRLGRKKRQ